MSRREWSWDWRFGSSRRDVHKSAGGTAPWTPLDLGAKVSLAFHLPWDLMPTDAPPGVQGNHQNAGITHGDKLSGFTDWGPSALHALQSIGNRQPLLDDGVSVGSSGLGTAMASFDGIDDALEAINITLVDTFSTFFVGRPAAGLLRFVYEFTSNYNSFASAQWLLAVPSGNTTPVSNVKRFSKINGVRGPWATGALRLLEQTYISSSNTHILEAENVDIIASASANDIVVGSATDNLYIGSRAGTSFEYSGEYGSLWIFKDLTFDERTQVREWLNAYYGGI